MSEALVVRLDDPKFYTRTVNLKDYQGYGVDRTALVKSWKIVEPGVKALMAINGVVLQGVDSLDFLDGKTFEVGKIRQALREIIPMCQEENRLCTVEAALFSSQLLGTEYYRYFKEKWLFELMFTGELCVTFKPQVETGDLPQRIAIEETYALSDVQLHQRLRNGESLEDIDRRNRDESTALEVSFTESG